MAKYLVIREPGIQLESGMVRRGSIVTLPDDAVPSRTSLAPLDQAAYDALVKEKERYVADYDRRLGELNPPRKLSERDRKRLMFVPPVPKAPEKPKVEEPTDGASPQTLRELGDEHGGAVGTREQKGKKVRASDAQ